MAVLGEIGRGTTPRFVLKTLCSTGDIDTMELTVKSGAITLLKTLKAHEAYTWYPYTGDATCEHIYTKWLAARPTQDSDMSNTPNSWIGVHYATTSTAPTAFTSYTWYHYEATEELGAYAHIKWSAALPATDANLKNTPYDYIGICLDDNPTAPTAADAYQWFLYKGEVGGTGGYIHIKWLASKPTQDSDMTDSPNRWIGVHAGSGETAPSAYADYDWYQYDGIAEPKTFVYIKWAAEQPTEDEDMSDTPSNRIGIYAGPIAAAPKAMTLSGDEHRIYVDLTQAETLALSDEITYQYHYRLKDGTGYIDGFTNSSRIYRRAVRELLSGREMSI